MKIVKPQNLPFTSNIPEPDPNQGEAVYSASTNVTYPFDSSGNAISAYFDSINSNIKVLTSANSLERSLSIYSSNYAKLNDTYFAGAGTVRVSSEQFTGATHSDSFGDTILMCVPDEDGTSQLIRRSTDGGQTFTTVNASVYSSTELVIHYVNFVSSTEAYAFAFDSSDSVSIVKSTDAGATWAQSYVAVNLRGGAAVENIKTAFDGTYLSVFTPLRVARLSPSTGCWFSLNSNLSANTSLKCTRDSNASGNGGYIYSVFSSSESGNSWVKIYSTNNGGETWSEVRTVLDGFQSQSLVQSIINISNSSYYYFESGSNVAITNSTSIELPIGSGYSCNGMALSGGKIIAPLENGVVFVIDNATKKPIILGSSEEGGDALDLLVLNKCIAIRYDGGFYHAPIGNNFRFSSIYNSVDSSTSGSSSTDYYNVAGVNYSLVATYNSNGSTLTRIRAVIPNSFQYVGQMASDDTFIYQLVRESTRWYVYKINHSTGDFSKENLGDAYTQNIDAVNSNPTIAFVGSIMHVPINTAGLTGGKFDKVLSIDKTPSVTIELTPNQIVSAGVVGAFHMGSTSFNWLLSNSTTEIVKSDTFDSLGGYREGDEVISTSTHRVYRATTDTVDTPEAGSKKSPPTWTDVSPTNKYAFRDIYIHNRSIAKNDGTVDGNKVIFNVTFENSADSISFFGLQNTDEIVIYYYDEGGPPSMDTKVMSLIDYEATLKTGEQTLLESFVVIGDNFNEEAVSARIELRPDGSGNAVAVGRMITGKAVELGVTQYGAKLSIEDFSRRERDEFGNFSIIPRNTAKNIDFDVKIPKENVNFVFTYLSKLTTIPCVFLGDDDDAAVQVYGYYSDYTHNIDYPSITSATISVEGLT